jgi:hypothetical protein
MKNIPTKAQNNNLIVSTINVNSLTRDKKAKIEVIAE